jgi:proteasome lid subunit RPN8/RPN11
MTEFDTKTDVRNTRGVCNKIRNQKRAIDAVFDILDKTRKPPKKEYAIALVEDRDGVLHPTKSVQGDEESIEGELISDLRFQAMGHEDIDFNNREVRVHLIHTHPTGHPDLSMNDIYTQIQEMDAGVPMVSTLALTDHISNDKDRAVVNGMEMVKEPLPKEMEEIKSRKSAIKKMINSSRMSVSQGKRELWSVLDTYFQDCSAELQRF